MKILCLAVLIAACQGEPQRTDTTSNKEYKVGLLFVHDGCRVYRFYDGNTVYFVKCDTPARTEAIHYNPATKTYDRTEVPTDLYPLSVEAPAAPKGNSP